MNKRLRTILQYIFFFGLGIFFVWLSLRNLDKENIRKIRTSIENARHWLIIPVFFILFLSHYVRGLRWRLLIEPLGHTPSRMNTFFAVMIGYLVNQGVPRLGEVVKCTVLARYEKVTVDKLIGTIIVERIIDALTLLTIFGITLAIQPDLYNRIIDTFFNSGTTAETKKTSYTTITLIVVGIGVIALIVWMFLKKKTPRDLLLMITVVGRRIMEGITSVRHLKKRYQFIFLTIFLWSLYFAGGYIGFMAFRETEHYGVREAFAVLSAGSIGMIASPGGIGAYAIMIEKTMQLYGLSQPIAVAFGWILWLVTTAVIVIGGLISFVAIPYYNKRIRQLEKEIAQKKIMTADILKEKVAEWKAAGKKVAFTNGVFDIIHPGHIFSLTQASGEADHLIVGLNSDRSVKRLKGESRPVNNEESRALAMASMRIVDAVVIFEEDTPLELIKLVLPDVLVKGGDYTIGQVAGSKEVIAAGGRVVINPILEGHSTTAIIEQLKKDGTHPET